MLKTQLEQKSQQLNRRLRANVLPAGRTCFQFTFNEDPAFYLQVNTSRCSLISGVCEDPDITLIIDNHQTCWGLLTGDLDGMEAFMSGNYRADGNIVLSQLLLYLFHRTDPAVTYELKD
jgi:putative sterol carrier protein